MFDIEKVMDLFRTELDKAYFWSGLGHNGAEIAAQTAKVNGGTTLEMLMEKNKAALVDAGFPYDSEFNRFIWDVNDTSTQKAWSDISQAYANQASGDVHAVLGDGIRDSSIWRRTELGTILDNLNISTVNGVPRQQLSDIYNGSGKNIDTVSRIVETIPTNNTNVSVLDDTVLHYDNTFLTFDSNSNGKIDKEWENQKEKENESAATEQNTLDKRGSMSSYRKRIEEGRKENKGNVQEVREKHKSDKER